MSANALFDESACPTADKLRNFAKYVRRQDIARFLCRYEIFKRQLHVKGSLVECGVHHGGGLMTWAQISAILEPYNQWFDRAFEEGYYLFAQALSTPPE